MRLFGSLLLALMLLALVPSVATQARAGTIDFTILPPDQAVTNQYPGVVFSLMGGNDPSGSPTTSGCCQGTSYGGLTNTNDAGGYPTAEFLVATFSVPVTGVEFSFYDAGWNGGNAYTLYDASDNVITSAQMPEASGSSYTYDLPSYTGVSQITWDNGATDGGSTNGGDWWQDLQSLSFTPQVPEPSTWALLGPALLGFLFLRRKQA